MGLCRFSITRDVVVGLVWAGLVDLAGALGRVGVFVVFVVFADFPHYL